MLTANEKFTSIRYWTQGIQNDLFRAFYDFQEKNGLSDGEMCDKLGIKQSKIKQILSGSFKGNIEQFVELSLKIGLIPFVNFYSVDKYIDEDKNTEFGLDNTLIITPHQKNDVKLLKALHELMENQVDLDPDIAEMIEEKFWDMI